MVSLVAILRPSADGNYLLLWTAADGASVIPLYKGDRTARETLATARRRKPGGENEKQVFRAAEELSSL
ncbi:MAG: hypothetical protein U0Y68_20695 [Blastocatellia bacterium]